MTTNETIRLIGRSSSHFTRVAAIFAHELGVPFELVVVHDLMSTDPEAFGGNPALKIPTLKFGETLLFGTENICRRLVALAGRQNDTRIVLTEQLTDDIARNAQELVWHAMSAHVGLIVGTMLGKLPADNVMFVKMRTGLQGALAWLDNNIVGTRATLPARDLSLLEVSLFCLLEHLVFRVSVPIEPYAELRRFAAELRPRESARRTEFRFD